MSRFDVPVRSKKTIHVKWSKRLSFVSSYQRNPHSRWYNRHWLGFGHECCWSTHDFCWLKHHFCWRNHHFCWFKYPFFVANESTHFQGQRSQRGFDFAWRCGSGGLGSKLIHHNWMVQLIWSAWCFQTFFIFLHNIWNNHPNWLSYIFQDGSCTTKQFLLGLICHDMPQFWEFHGSCGEVHWYLNSPRVSGCNQQFHGDMVGTTIHAAFIEGPIYYQKYTPRKWIPLNHGFHTMCSNMFSTIIQPCRN